MHLNLDESISFDPFLCNEGKHCARSLEQFDENPDVTKLFDVLNCFAIQIKSCC